MWPDIIVSWFSRSKEDSTHFIRFIGAALLGFSVTNWFYSRSRDIRTVQPALIGNLASLSLAVIIDIAGLISGEVTQAGWLMLLVHATFGTAFMYSINLLRNSDR